MTVGEETRICKAGDIITIPSNVPHSVEVISECIVIDAFQPARDDYKNEYPYSTMMIREFLPVIEDRYSISKNYNFEKMHARRFATTMPQDNATVIHDLFLVEY